MRRSVLLIATLLFMAVTAFATFVIIKNDGTIVHINLDKLPVEQSGESFTINGIDVNDIAHIYNKVWDSTDDYERAFVQGYLAKGYYYYDRKQQITSQEFKAMLKPLVEKYSPDKMDYFNSRISDVDIPITRSIAVGMAYYAARCIGAFYYNSPYNRSTYGDVFDDIWDNLSIMEVLPYGLTKFNETDPEDMISAALQNADHVSVVSNKEIIEYYLGKGWLWNDVFTWEDAVRAITRLYDSFEPARLTISHQNCFSPEGFSCLRFQAYCLYHKIYSPKFKGIYFKSKK